MRRALSNLVRQNRQTMIATIIAKGCQKFLRAYNNENYWDPETNGEARAIRLLSENVQGPLTAFDVGANIGEWSISFSKIHPNCRIHSFEIIPGVATQLQTNVSNIEQIVPHTFGLSDVDTNVEVAWNRTLPTTSTIHPNPESDLLIRGDMATIACRVRRGDDFVAENGIKQIGFLKIDTEGHEVSVLEGFSKTLRSPAAPRVIQFEYGETFLPARRQLRDVYQLLGDCGYTIGRIFPHSIGFKNYETIDDNFRMGNYLAVRKDDPLLKMMSG